MCVEIQKASLRTAMLAFMLKESGSALNAS